jgi:sugar phosphate isomerase/epimerase
MTRLSTVHYSFFLHKTYPTIIFFSGIRTNVYSYGQELDPNEFVLLAVQHYYVIHGKDVEPDKMKQIIQDILPTPYTTPPGSDGKSANKKIKPILNEKQIDAMVQSAVQKDTDVSGINILKTYFRFL